MNVVTPTFRVSYPNVFTARTNAMNGKEEFSIVALFKKGEDLSALIAEAQEATAKKFGADKAKWPKNMRSPFRDQADREKGGVLPPGYEEGAIFLNLKSLQAPSVVDQKIQPILEPKDFYAGCYARASISAYAYDMKGNRGVAFGLRNLQKIDDGESLGGVTKPEDDFEAVAMPKGAEGEALSATDIFTTT